MKHQAIVPTRPTLKNAFLCCTFLSVAALTAVVCFASPDDQPAFRIARLRYGGGGDWYSDPSSLPNLMRFLHEETGLKTATEEKVVSLTDPDLWDYPYLYLTGHGSIRFTETEARRLREYLQRGGFLHADDNFGLDEYLRPELRKIFPDSELVEIPFDHEIYRIYYKFPDGLPKIHEHHGGAAQGYGIFLDGRLVLFYSYNTDLGDGWEDPEVHDNPEEKRLAALQMGVNIILYALTH